MPIMNAMGALSTPRNYDNEGNEKYSEIFYIAELKASPYLPSVYVNSYGGTAKVIWSNGRVDEIVGEGSATQPTLPTTNLTVKIISTTGNIHIKHDINFLKVIQWGTHKFLSAKEMFAGSYSNYTTFDQVGIPDFSQCTDMSYMFNQGGFGSGTNNFSKWDTSKVTNMSYMFAYNGALPNVKYLDTSSVTDMSYMFYGSGPFNEPIGSWNTGNVTNMDQMFWRCSTFNQPIGTWDTSKVTNMRLMFNIAPLFNQPIGTWNTGNVTTMDGMFFGALNFNQPIGTWDTSKVTNMSRMFWGSKFNQPIGTWNTGNVTDMSNMFNGYDYININTKVSLFNQNINTWNTGNVTNMSFMFDGAEFFTSPLYLWDVLKVTNMDYMFRNATRFNSPLGRTGGVGWKVNNVTSMVGMFLGATYYNQNLSSWCVTNISTKPSLFDQGATGWVLPNSRPVWGTCPIP